MASPNEVKDKILSTASDLFYKHGIRAVGVDLVVEKAGVAKTSLYRYFPTKDDLVVAFLQSKDRQFYALWDDIAAKYVGDPEGALFEFLEYMGGLAADPCFRGCPQLNIVAEFPDIEHPARKLATAHKLEMRRRLKVLAEEMKCKNPDELAGQLVILVNGAITSTPIYESPEEAKRLLLNAARTLLAAARS